MRNLARRGLMLAWLIFGVLPLSVVWTHLSHWMVILGADEAFARFVCLMVMYVAYIFVFWLITEIPKKDDAR